MFKAEPFGVLENAFCAKKLSFQIKVFGVGEDLFCVNEKLDTALSNL